MLPIFLGSLILLSLFFVILLFVVPIIFEAWYPAALWTFLFSVRAVWTLLFSVLLLLLPLTVLLPL